MKHLLTVLILILYSYISLGCDLHGYSFGSSPFISNKNTFSISYRNSSFQGIHSHGNYEPITYLSAEKYSETFNYMSVAGAFNVLKNIQLLVNLPLVYNYTKGDHHGDTIHKGLGDISILVATNFSNKTEKYSYNLNFICGLSLPTGKYNQTNTLNKVDFDLQTGTGSLATITGIGFNYIREKTGFESSLTYKTNNNNPLNYRFSNRLNLKGILYFKLIDSSIRLYPKTGFYFESANMDEYNSIKQNNTGGKALFYSYGLNANFKNTVISLEHSIVAIEKLNGMQGSNENRLNIKLTYIIK